MSQLPGGTVTFVFTDIEGSTRLLTDIGRERYEELLGVHRRLLREAIEETGGHLVGLEGDGCFAVFRSGADAVASAASAQRGLAAHPWPADANAKKNESPS